MEFSSRMEEELKCPSCRRIVINPVTLPTCQHSICLDCATRLQMPLPMPLVSTPSLLASKNLNDSGIIVGPCSSASRIALSGNVVGSGGVIVNVGNLSGDVDETGSIFSETDSGVVCSRPDSYVGVGSQSLANISGLYQHQSSQQNCQHGNIAPAPTLANGSAPQVAITCPVCTKSTYTDEKGALSLPKTKTLAAIATRYRETKQLQVNCQICNGSSQDPSCPGLPSPSFKPANQMCKECEIFYCNECHKIYHTQEGHKVLDMEEAKDYLLDKELKCFDHPDEKATMFCVQCKVSVCESCKQQRHMQHQLQPLLHACKTHKAELSQMLHSLSEKAKSGTEFIARLKGLQERVEMNSSEFEQNVMNQCDQLIEAIQQHKKKLSNVIQTERSQKLQAFKDQMVHCSSRVQKTTGLLQFSIEALKEADPLCFLQISSSLINKVSTVDTNFVKEVEFEPRESAEFEYRLDSSRILRAIESLELVQMKAPGVPQILPRECTSESNTITVVWESNANRGGCPDGFVLEIDDGNMGNFRKVFSGKETICTVEGLHFDTGYRARVKAFNMAGDSGYSQCITLKTSRVAWFTFDPCNLSCDVTLSNNNMTVSSGSFDDRVILGSVGFVRGVHFWEYVVDRYENNKDPAFGVARYDVNKEKMLGKDDKGWSTYIDNTRSWFIHDGQHVGRTHGGLGVGSVVGVLLDLEQRYLSFFLNGQRHGPIVAFSGLSGVFYPAVSLNRNVQITLNSGLEPPLVPLITSAPNTTGLGLPTLSSTPCNFQLRIDNNSDQSIAT